MRLDDGQPLQARAPPCSTRDGLRTLVTDREQLPHRPLRARGPRRARGLELRARVDRARATLPPGRARRALPRRLPLGRAGRHGGAHGRPAAADDRLGPLALGRRGAGRARRAAASSSPSAAPTSTSTPGPGAPAYLYVRRRRCRSGCARRSRAGSARTTSSPWSAGYAPAAGIARFLAGTPPILDLAAVEEGVRLTAEAGIARAAREVRRADRADRRAARRAGWRRWASALGSPRDPARARLARLAAPRGGLADLPRADRARGRRPGLPRPGLDPSRRRAALHPLRRRLGRDRPPARPGRARGSSATSTPRRRA